MTSIASAYEPLDMARSSANARAATTATGAFDEAWTQAGSDSPETADLSSATSGSIRITPGASILRFADLIAAGTLKPINVAELPEDRYQAFMEQQKQHIEAEESYLRRQYTGEPQFPDLSRYPGTKTYATVVVGGKVVATIDNQGVIGSSDAIARRLNGKLPDEINGKNGPDLAQARAEAAARLLGGRIVKAPTAITQTQFDALPVPQVIPGQVDAEAMKNDPLYAQIERMREKDRQTAIDRAAYLARQTDSQPTA